MGFRIPLVWWPWMTLNGVILPTLFHRIWYLQYVKVVEVRNTLHATKRIPEKTVCLEKRDQNVCVISSTKLRRFWYISVASFRSQFAVKSCKRFPPHLNNVSTLHSLWNLKYSSRTCSHWAVKERNSRIYPISTVASKFARFESSWL